ncbi:MAG: PD-(D/E)XK nuclease family protein [Chloroflexi bacterium]|nr:PD-(D/E)XK nuclease family protein [Chloroflexota bacterium]
MKESALYVERIEQAQERLERLLAEYQRDDRFAPVTVIVPSTYAGLYLRRDMGRRGLVNVQFMVLPRLAELLGAAGLAAESLKPLKPTIESAAVRRAAGEASGRLEPFRAHPSFHSSLRWTFRDLRLGGPSVLASLERRGEIPAEIVRLYSHFRKITESYYDREDLADAAADTVAGGNVTALSDLGPVIAYLLTDLTPAERRLLDALGSAWKCSAVLGITGDEEADEVVLARAAPRGTVPPDPIRPPAPAARETSLLITSDTREEVRSVVRAVASAAHGGTPFHRMAVLYWQREPYATLIAEQFGMAGVPTAGPTAGRLASTPVGRMVKGLVDLAGGDVPRDEVMRWLTSCPVRSTSAGFRPSRWDAISRDAGIVGGLEQWRDRLGHYAGRQERAANDQSEDIPEAKLLRIKQTASEAWALRAFMLRLDEVLTPPDDGSAWREFVEWADDLIGRYMDTASLPSIEMDNYEKIQAGLRELDGLDDVEDGATLERFRVALDEALGGTATREGAFGEGVFVGTVGNAVGLRFDKVFLLGMVEGLVPPRVRDDPLLPDDDREQAGLPLRRGTAVERSEYLAAASAGRATVLTFARGDNAAQKEQHPSRWFLEEASRLHGSSVYPSMLSSATELATLREQPWLEVVASAQESLKGVSESQSADLHDYDLHHLWRWRRAGKRIGDHHIASTEKAIARALGMERARNGRTLTIWDGDLSATSSSSGRIGLSNREFFSPTRLETWATCPYRYFLSHVLGIAAPEQPEEIATISPMDKGSLVHTVLERFVQAVQEQGTVPLPDRPWTEDHGRLLMGIAEEEFREAEGRGVTGKPLLWEIAQAEIRGDLRRFLEEDFDLRHKHGVSPHAAESAFGTSGHDREDTQAQAPVEWSSAATGTIRFRGIIDRIDVSPSGDAALVLDYKTGGTTQYSNMDKDPVRRGTRLQLPVYGLAARQLLGEGVELKAAYWFVSAKGNFKTRPQKPAPLDDMMEPFADAVGTITDGIDKGVFPAYPGKDNANCSYCDFKNLCPTRREWHWRQKRGDGRVAAYAEMAEGEGSR